MSQITDGETVTEEQQTNQEDIVDALISLAITVTAIVFLVRSQQYMGISSSSEDPGAAFWPQLVLIVLLISSLVNLYNIYKRNRNIIAVSEHLGEINMARDNLLQTRSETKQYLMGIVLIAVYLVVLNSLGFVISTSIFLMLFIWTLGYRSIPKTIVFSLTVSFIVFIVFRSYLNIALPYGTGIFRELGIFLESLT